MITEADAKRQLREWVVQNSKKEQLDGVSDDTALIEDRIITSVQILDLILFLERMREEPVDLGLLKPGSFKNINTVYDVFLAAKK